MDNDGILIRLVDDFLFITLNRKNATNFLSTMYRGLPEYGAKIAVEKCLVNFETSVDGNKINRLVGTLEFPYCGNTIHTKTLDFRKDMDRRRDSSRLYSAPYTMTYKELTLIETCGILSPQSYPRMLAEHYIRKQ